MRPHSLVTAITGSVRPSHVGGTARHRHQTPGRCAASLARHCHHRVSAASLPVLSISLSFARRGVPLTAVSVLLKLSLGRVLSVSLSLLSHARFLSSLFLSHGCFLCFVFCFVFCVLCLFRRTVLPTHGPTHGCSTPPHLARHAVAHLTSPPAANADAIMMCSFTRIQQPGMMTLACRCFAFF